MTNWNDSMVVAAVADMYTQNFPSHWGRHTKKMSKNTKKEDIEKIISQMNRFSISIGIKRLEERGKWETFVDEVCSFSIE